MSKIDDLANELVQAWLDNYASNGVQAFRENERKRADIIARAVDAGVYEAVYARANTLLHGNQ